MFFGYFLNTKKVTPSADSVISPAKAGAFLFSHTRRPLSRRAGAPTAKPRPLLPFGRISPAAKPGWPVVAPAGGNVLAPPFSLRSNVAPRSHPGPCSHSTAFRLRRNRAGRSSAPPGRERKPRSPKPRRSPFQLKVPHRGIFDEAALLREA